MEKYIKREIEQELKSALLEFPAVALTGPRQAGKSTMLMKALGSCYGYVSLDSENERRQAKEDPAFFLSRMPERIIIDEIQYAPELLPEIKLAIDKEPKKAGRFILTGSQYFLMMRDFSETLAGRLFALRMPQLSLGEISEFTGQNNGRKLFEHACLRTTYPALTADMKRDRHRWYTGYLNTYIERDVRSLYNVGDTREFDIMIRMLSGVPGQILNMSKLASGSGVSVTTIKRWMSILEASGLIYILKPWHASVKKRFVKSPKIYFTDTGFICHLNGIRNAEDIYSHRLFGELFENYCVSEALKCFMNMGVPPDVYYYREDKGPEADFLINAGGKMHVFEFKAGMKAERKMADTAEALIVGRGGVEAVSGAVVTLNDSPMQLSDSVKSIGTAQMIKEINKIVKQY